MSKKIACVSVHLSEELFFIIDKLSSKQNLNLMTWYIGTRGLKEEAHSYFKENLFKPFFTTNPKGRLWLLDLTSWGAFRNPSLPIDRESHHFEQIKKLRNNQINCVSSKDIFEKFSIFSRVFPNYFKHILGRNFLYQKSKKHQPIGKTIDQLFGWKIAGLFPYSDLDLANAYSAFQYLEAILLIIEIARKSSSTNPIEIAFVLPNDEPDYYFSEKGVFEKDLNEFLFLMEYMGPDLNISFYSFDFGKHVYQRPYCIPGKKMKNKALRKEDFGLL